MYYNEQSKKELQLKDRESIIAASCQILGLFRIFAQECLNFCMWHQFSQRRMFFVFSAGLCFVYNKN